MTTHGLQVDTSINTLLAQQREFTASPATTEPTLELSTASSPTSFTGNTDPDAYTYSVSSMPDEVLDLVFGSSLGAAFFPDRPIAIGVTTELSKPTIDYAAMTEWADWTKFALKLMDTPQPQPSQDVDTRLAQLGEEQTREKLLSLTSRRRAA